MREIFYLIEKYLVGSWKYRWIAVAVAFCVAIAGWVGLAFVPDKYEAMARVYVDTSSDLGRLLDEQILDPNIEEELLFMQYSMLGQIQLEKVARQTDMLLAVNSPAETQVLLDRLADDIELSGEGGRRGVPNNIYTINYANQDPDLAENVVRTLLDIFMEETLGSKRSNSETSGRFLTEQINEYEQRLQESEQRLADFNRRNFDRLPGQQGSYLEKLQSEIDVLEMTRQSLRLAQSRKRSLEEQIAGEAPNVTDPNGIDPNSPQGRLLDNQIRLDELLLRFTDQHPSVIATRETIRKLEDQVASLGDQAGQSSYLANNPIYQATKISLNEVETEIAQYQVDIETKQRSVDSLRELIDEITDVEAQNARLNRDYDVVQAQYQNLVDSLERQKLTEEAMLSESVEFRVIDPPQSSIVPVYPNRTLLIPFILIAALGVGAAAALALFIIRPVFVLERDVTESMNIPLLGSLSATRGTIRLGEPALILALLALLALFGVVYGAQMLGLGLQNMLG